MRRALRSIMCVAGSLAATPVFAAQPDSDAPSAIDWRIAIEQDDAGQCVYGDGENVRLSRVELAFMLVGSPTSQIRLVLVPQAGVDQGCVDTAHEMVDGLGFASVITEIGSEAETPDQATASHPVEATVDESHDDGDQHGDHDGPSPYDPDSEAMALVDAALERVLTSGKRVIIVMGANWCHDSRGLAERFENPRFVEMLSESYEVVYVDAGQPRAGLTNNLDVAQRFGVEQLEGTPNVLVLSAEGDLLNPESATSWNDAASREEDDVFDYFFNFQPEI